MRSKRPWLVLGITIVMAVGAWSFLKMPKSAALNENCQPVGLMNEWRAAILPEGWRDSQLQAIDRELRLEGDWPRTKAELDKTTAEVEALIERQRRELNLPPPSKADQLRALADDVEAQEIEKLLASYRAERLRNLVQCRVALQR